MQTEAHTDIGSFSVYEIPVQVDDVQVQRELRDERGVGLPLYVSEVSIPCRRDVSVRVEAGVGGRDAPAVCELPGESGPDGGGLLVHPQIVHVQIDGKPVLQGGAEDGIRFVLHAAYADGEGIAERGLVGEGRLRHEQGCGEAE